MFDTASGGRIKHYTDSITNNTFSDTTLVVKNQNNTFTAYTTNSTSTTGLANYIGGSNVVITDAYYQNNDIDIEQGHACCINMPDGSVIRVDEKGNYVIEDKDAKVTYRAHRMREFNRYLNASDMLEQFIKDLGLVGVKQDEVLKVPIQLFINWLIVKSAEQDGEEVPDVPRIEDQVKKPVQCKHCGRFVSPEKAKKGLQFCNAEHYELYEQKLVAS